MDFNQIEFVSDGTVQGTKIVDKFTGLPLEGVDYVAIEWLVGQVPSILVGSKGPTVKVQADLAPKLTLKPIDCPIQEA